MYGLCKHSVVPVRAEPSDRAEMVTQLMFGDAYQVISEEEKWLKLKNWYDGYEGWIDPKLHSLVSDQYFDSYTNTSHGVMTTRNEEVIIDGIPRQILRGSVLPFLKNGKVDLDGQYIQVEAASFKSIDYRMEEIAAQYIGTPYLWGGKSPFGIDCSGLSQQVARIAGKKILRDASQQATQGTKIDRKDAQAGDFAFFNNLQGKIIHVGVLSASNEVIHAHGFVKRSRFDEHGLLKDDSSDYTHHLSHLVRI